MNRNISNAKRTIAYNNSDGKCIYCGKKVNKPIVKFIIPKSVFKWSEAIDNMANNDNNIFICCENCNNLNCGRIPTEKEIWNYHIKQEKKVDLIRFRRDTKKYINQYINMKHRVWQKQGRRCIVCHKDKDIKDYNLRRIDDKLPRTEDNAIAICPDCQDRYIHIPIKKGE
jgi:hypothetical protein